MSIALYMAHDEHHILDGAERSCSDAPCRSQVKHDAGRRNQVLSILERSSLCKLISSSHPVASMYWALLSTARINSLELGAAVKAMVDSDDDIPDDLLMQKLAAAMVADESTAQAKPAAAPVPKP
eukprot:1492700-Amphidinium_carterae.2